VPEAYNLRRPLREAVASFWCKKSRDTTVAASARRCCQLSRLGATVIPGRLLEHEGVIDGIFIDGNIFIATDRRGR
jgi:hypothetical protein